MLPAQSGDRYQVAELDNRPAETSGGWGALDALPGNPMMWILILSELVVFGAFFGGYAVARLLEPDVFAQSQAMLNRFWGGLNTMILITSGLFAALAHQAKETGRSGLDRTYLIAAMILGIAFLVVKWVEYSEKAAQGIHIETNSFFTLFYLMTGFHALHVVLGIIFLAVVWFKNSRENIATACAFWHMVDLIWVILYPIIYLMR